ncbi:MAG: hybrid sensor histidine kinase/response regulator, partial [Terriglobia bacterium]
TYETLLRAAHSVKGAARIVDHSIAVELAHTMEDWFVAAQRGNVTVPKEQIDILLNGVDLLTQLAQEPPDANALKGEVEALLAALSASKASPDLPASTSVAAPRPSRSETAWTVPRPPGADSKRALRITTETLDRLQGLAGETLVASRWFDQYVATMTQLKSLHQGMSHSLDVLQDALAEGKQNERTAGHLLELVSKTAANQQALSKHLEEMESFDRRFMNLSHRLYEEALDCRMRPFGDGIEGFPRMVRDLARRFKKEIRLEINGHATPVDRDILERLESPLNHLLRNAIDHGIELPEERRQSHKPEVGTIRLEAQHRAGMLVILVADDGRGVDLETLRKIIVEKELARSEVAQRMNAQELLNFMFLPGFTMKHDVTEISGRGVGLDVVQSMVKEVGGTLHASTRPGQGMQIELQLPLTLSVMRALLVEIGGEPYAIPSSRITRVLKIPKGKIEVLEGRQFFSLGTRQIGLVTAHQVLGCEASGIGSEEISILLLGEANRMFGVVVDRFLEERELVVRPLDPRLGKIQDIVAAALMPDGSPVLIVDVEDLIRSIETMISGERLTQITKFGAPGGVRKQKRILVVDDSLTVRELERKLLDSQGYSVEVAVDGMDGWNAIRTGHYDLVVTDIDMPRLDGIELVTMIKKDARFGSLPVMVVSYKDRDEDRHRGLEAGADYYLTKGSFHEEALLQAVVDLIGEGEA